jgi:predicted HTH transcriptional regulator
MSARTDDAWNELNANSYRKAELDEQIMNQKADRYWLKKHFGEKIKITGNLMFAKTPEDFLREIDRQNKLIAQGLQ